MASRNSRVATTRDLTSAQRRLVEVMSAHQFGRIENLPVRRGEPLFDQNVRIVRAAHLGGRDGGTSAPQAGDFELKQVVCDLFDELLQLQDGTIVRLEFRHGLPCLLETIAVVPPS
jgi:hypothetical protein